MANLKLSGKCLCDACAVEIVPAEQALHVCHCDMCRAWTGMALMAVKVMPGDLKIEGPVRTRQTSAWAERAWCDECGSALFYRVTAEGPYHGVAHVASGLFENAGGLLLTGELYTDKRPGGYSFAGNLHGMTQAEVEAMFSGEGDQA